MSPCTLSRSSLDCAVYGAAVKRIAPLVECHYALVLSWPRHNWREYKVFDVDPSEKESLNLSRLLGSSWSVSSFMLFGVYGRWTTRETVNDAVPDMEDMSEIIPREDEIEAGMDMDIDLSMLDGIPRNLPPAPPAPPAPLAPSPPTTFPPKP